MLTLEEIVDWHNPPSSEQQKRLLALANQFFNITPDSVHRRAALFSEAAPYRRLDEREDNH